MTGRLVSREDALDGCERILRDEFRDYPEAALYMIGGIDAAPIMDTSVENLDDTGIGQCFADIGPVVDYISPMLYPSSFQLGIPGPRNPLNDPHRIVFASLERAKQRTGFSGVTFRPWLQPLNDYAFDRRNFGAFQLEQQIKAAQDGGAEAWLLWDPRNRYPTEVLSEPAPKLWWHTNQRANDLKR